MNPVHRRTRRPDTASALITALAALGPAAAAPAARAATPFPAHVFAPCSGDGPADVAPNP
ncbi:hypothetical protein [Streptomyces anandii]|uniref:hypothetical protein n=1 Tax=Streptomyces anandii TaxID=285454 RepID=UPI001671C7DA|nr:hypothetical protein [Streptomyces anandii]GGY12996.1 hypothetical protein GCM10010510_68850 [Streptomyces anandii JCM 4720]